MSLATSTELALGGAAVVAAFGAVAAVRLLAIKSDSQIYGRTLVGGSDPTELALTYDDGPNDRSTPELLDVLSRYNIQAAFFMVGKFVRLRPDLVRSVQAAGHLIGNHTMTHPNLTKLPLTQARAEIQACSQILEDTTGVPVRYFRAPFGARRPAVLRCVRELGMIPVQWNAHGQDWDPIGVDGILAHLDTRMARARAKGRGVNVLLHDGSDQAMGSDRSDTVRATDLLIQQSLAAGRRFVTLDAWA